MTARCASFAVAAVVALALASREAIAPHGVWPIWIEGSFGENFFAWFTPIAFAMATVPFRSSAGVAPVGAVRMFLAWLQEWLIFGAALLLLRLALLWPSIQYLENLGPVVGPVYSGVVSVLFVWSSYCLLRRMFDCSAAYAVTISLFAAAVGQVWAKWDSSQVFGGAVMLVIWQVGQYSLVAEGRVRAQMQKHGGEAI